MSTADVQYMRLIKLIQSMDKRLAKIEAQLLGAKPKQETLGLPKKANSA